MNENRPPEREQRPEESRRPPQNGRPDVPQSAPRKRKKKRRGNPALAVIGTIFKVLGTLLLVGLTTGAILACFGVVYINTVIVPEAGLDLYELTVDMSQSSIMYYVDQSTGQQRELRTIHGEENRIWIKYKDIPEDLINATVAIEDKRFFTHQGVDWLRTGAAVVYMFTGRNIQGGSTITQQLIKNLTQDDDVTVKRKVLEIFRALEFEKMYSKEVILENYLNYIYLGQGCNGIYTASYRYFGKNVSELSLAECASLISITNNPSIYDPYRAGYDKDGKLDREWGRKNNATRALNVLYQMSIQKDRSGEPMITEAEYEEARAQVKAGLNFTSAAVGGGSQSTGDGSYSWYEDLVIRTVINDLVAKGYDRKVAANLVYYGGLKIETCIDLDVQAVVDSVYENMENLKVISSSGQQLQSAIVIIDPNGDVVALAGGMGEKEGDLIWSRATDSKRPPGSSFKPLSVYAPAIEAGLITPVDVMDDAPYRLEGTSAWPTNSDGVYRGRISIFEAVQRSSNTVAVRTLAMLSPEESYDFLTRKLGFGEDLVYNETRNGRVFTDVDLAPLSMGGLTDGVSVLNMAAAFSMFPRGGVYLAPRCYTMVKDSTGRILLDNTTDRGGVPVISEETAWYMNSMLKNVVAKGTGTRAKFDQVSMTIAGKTGTTTSKKDNWFVGYSPYYTAAVWVGYDQQERITQSGNVAIPLWKKVMEPLHEGLENVDFETPGGLTRVNRICASSGMLQTEYCLMDPRGDLATTGQLFRGDDSLPYCTLHTADTVVEVCTDCPILNAKGQATGMYYLAGPYCPVESRKTVCLMGTERPEVNGVVANDFAFTKQYLDSLGEGAYCTAHTTPPEPVPYDPMLFDPTNSATWPTQEQWPGFNIEDPTTWPFATGPDLGGDDDPWGDDPWEDGPAQPTESQPPSPEPTQSPSGGLV